jgi:ribonuclease HII
VVRVPQPIALAVGFGLPIRTPLVLPKKPDLTFEMQLKGEGFRTIAGLDEAGRGAWAGPVTAAAVVLPNDEHVLEILSGVRDSKQMTARQREREESCIKAASIAWAVGSASEGEIDQMGIVPATRLAMQRALEQLTYSSDHLLLDYISLPESAIPQTPLVKGDCRSLSIAAASVLAKAARDAFMTAQDAAYPGYGFARHKGYGTAQHRAALKELGVTKFHRKTFRPMSIP